MDNKKIKIFANWSFCGAEEMLPTRQAQCIQDFLFNPTPFFKLFAVFVAPTKLLSLFPFTPFRFSFCFCFFSSFPSFILSYLLVYLAETILFYLLLYYQTTMGLQLLISSDDRHGQ